MATDLFIQFLACIVLVELLTEIIVKSEIFQPVRQRLAKYLGGWFGKLLSCGYCFSVWSAFAVVFFTKTSYPLIGQMYVDLSLSALVVHRFSNILHNVIDKWTDKYYDVRYVNSEKE